MLMPDYMFLIGLKRSEPPQWRKKWPRPNLNSSWPCGGSSVGGFNSINYQCI